MQVNYSIPVNLYDYRESENSLYSFAKLKVFYVGETADRRLFTKEFSDKLIKSLPYVPVVGYYDEQEDDFVGHNAEVQNIYGIVPEDTTIDFITENGKEYAVCDVILYTGRQDKTGKIAQKIVGKSHSLELNPTNTTYKVNKDTKGRIKNIEFTEGSLLGLSILGDSEKPAFTGSVFFKEMPEELTDEVKQFMNEIYRKECSLTDNNFSRHSYESKYERAYEALKEMYPNVRYEISQMTDMFIVYCEYVEDQNGTHKIHYKINYQDNGRTLELINGPEKVYVTYLTDDELDTVYGEETADWLDYKTIADLDLKPTESMAKDAERGLAMRREYGRGGTAVGIARARDISNRTNLSPRTVQRMYSYFSRHEVDKKAQGFRPGEKGYPSNGKIAWLLWGGDPGFSWATNKYNQIKKIREQMALQHEDVEVKLVDKETNVLQPNEVVSAQVATPVEPQDMVKPMEPKEEEKEMVKDMPEEIKDEMVYPKEDKEEEKEMVYPKEDDKKDYVVSTANSGTIENGLAAKTENHTEGVIENAEKLQQTVSAQVEVKEAISSTALINSEREELEAFRRQRKEGLIESFKDDLNKEFLENIAKDIDKYSYDQLDVMLAKEFTRISKATKQSKPNAFIYNPTTKSPVKSDVDLVKELVNKYKY